MRRKDKNSNRVYNEAYVRAHHRVKCVIAKTEQKRATIPAQISRTGTLKSTIVLRHTSRIIHNGILLVSGYHVLRYNNSDRVKYYISRSSLRILIFTMVDADIPIIYTRSHLYSAKRRVLLRLLLRSSMLHTRNL